MGLCHACQDVSNFLKQESKTRIKLWNYLLVSSMSSEAMWRRLRRRASYLSKIQHRRADWTNSADHSSG